MQTYKIKARKVLKKIAKSVQMVWYGARRCSIYLTEATYNACKTTYNKIDVFISISLWGTFFAAILLWNSCPPCPTGGFLVTCTSSLLNSWLVSCLLGFFIQINAGRYFDLVQRLSLLEKFECTNDMRVPVPEMTTTSMVFFSGIRSQDKIHDDTCCQITSAHCPIEVQMHTLFFF